MTGIFVIVSGPSGAGKTSIVSGCIKEHGIGARVITTTTRPRRLGEVHGRDYYFLSKREFVQKIKNGKFAEHALVYGHHYGTAIADIEKARKKNPVAIVIVDTQGAQALAKKYPEAQTVFISIPQHEMRQRLEAGGGREESMKSRLAAFQSEDAIKGLFKKVLLNESGQKEKTVEAFAKYLQECIRERVSVERVSRQRAHSQK